MKEKLGFNLMSNITCLKEKLPKAIWRLIICKDIRVMCLILLNEAKIYIICKTCFVKLDMATVSYSIYVHANTDWNTATN